MITMDEYQDAARETAIYTGIGEWEGVVYNALKLAGEAGEIADKVGKLHGKRIATNCSVLLLDEQIDDLKKEAGDVLWHLTNLCIDLGITLEDVANTNTKKLRSRKERGVLMSGEGDNR